MAKRQNRLVTPRQKHMATSRDRPHYRNWSFELRISLKQDVFLFSSYKMAKYYKEISHLLALSAESFEDELKKIVSDQILLFSYAFLFFFLISFKFILTFYHQGISTTHLTPFEVLTAINHAQLRLNCTFKVEEIQSGILADLMIEEDFTFEETVSLRFYKLEFAFL